MKALTSLMRKVRRDEGGFTLIELLIVIIILGVLAAVVAFNVSGFLGQGTCATAKTEANSVQTAILAGMAAKSVGTLDGEGTVSGNNITGTLPFNLTDYIHLPTHGTWTWDTSGIVVSGSYSGGGQTANLTNGIWSGADCG